MHGQRRDKYKARLKDERFAKALQAKANQWFQVSKVLVKKRHDDDADHNNNNDEEETMNLVEKLLLVNPDPLYLWNHRRDLLLLGKTNNNNNNDEENNNNNMSSLFQVEPELVLTRQALERNPKAYGPWFHRKWAIGYYLQQQQQQQQQCHHDSSSSSPCLVLLQKEIALTEQFLMLDERNFHCWNYRRFLIGCQLQLLLLEKETTTTNVVLLFDGHWPDLTTKMTYRMGPQVAASSIITDGDGADGTTTTGTTTDKPTTSITLLDELLQQEWDFTTKKITQNFSNGSALHYRLLLLNGWKLATNDNNDDEQQKQQQDDLLLEELELCHDAIFTEPDDQTTWWYYKELIKYDYIKSNQELLQSERDLLLELLDSEDNNCKWAWIGLGCVLEQILLLDKNNTDEDDESLTTIKQERIQAYENLIRLDPDRQQRYRYLMEKLL